ncbi:MAG: YhbY family RNA-binding protein [Treponema sp.]|nr:YhbY family RNA-binding protein [Treponema sp.]
MNDLTSSHRKYLSGAAHRLHPVVHIGQQGLTEHVVAQTDHMLRVHELIKVKFIDFKEQKHTLADSLAAQCSAALVRVIGNIAIFYRPAASAERRKYGITFD